MALGDLFLRICFLILVPAHILAFPSSAPRSSSRNFMSELPASGSLSSITQVKNPYWTRHRVSTASVYAAPFLKYHIPLPANLSSSLQTSPSRRDVNPNISLEPRASGQTVDGSDGECVLLLLLLFSSSKY